MLVWFSTSYLVVAWCTGRKNFLVDAWVFYFRLLQSTLFASLARFWPFQTRPDTVSGMILNFCLLIFFGLLWLYISGDEVFDDETAISEDETWVCCTRPRNGRQQTTDVFGAYLCKCDNLLGRVEDLAAVSLNGEEKPDPSRQPLSYAAFCLAHDLRHEQSSSIASKPGAGVVSLSQHRHSFKGRRRLSTIFEEEESHLGHRRASGHLSERVH